VLPSDWLLAAEHNRRHIATPDGLSPDHTLIAEAKTTGVDWGNKIPIKYRRQVQWQIYVTGAKRCLFLWQLRVDDGDWFRFGWWEPRWVWIDRDEQMITSLIATATRLLSLED
jgi:predicted phage-related endonuclease